MTVNPLKVFSWTTPDVIDGSDTHAWWKKTSVRQYYEKSISNTQMADEAGAIDIGTQYADNIKTILDKATTAGSNDTDYSVYVHGIGDRDNMKGLTHDDDVLDGYVDGSTLLGNGGPYTENGRAEAKEWCTWFLDAMKAQLDVLGYPYPATFHIDTETNIDVFNAATSSAGGGWFDEAYADARATTELVDGVNTFKDLVDNWITVDGVSLATAGWDVNASYWGTANKDLRDFMSFLNSTIRNYFLHDVLMEYAETIFPGKKWSNYQDFNAGTWDNPSTGRSKAGTRHYGSSLNTNSDRRLYGDFSSPVLYPMKATAFQDVGSSKSDWITTLGIESNMLLSGPPYDTFDYETVWTEACSQHVTGVVAAEGDAENVVPWIMYESWYVGANLNPNFIDDVDLVIIDSSDSSNFAVGNQIILQNVSDVTLYTADIVRIVDLEDGTHQINIDAISPDDSGASFGSVTKATDTTILTQSAVTSVAAEGNFIYRTEQSGILKVLDTCINLGINEYCFWQNPDLIGDESWDFNAEAIGYLEDGLGVLLGEVGSVDVHPFGVFVEFYFNQPANGDWDVPNIIIDSEKAPVITADGNIVSFEDPNIFDIATGGDNQITFLLNITSGAVGAGQELKVTFQQGWLTNPETGFTNAATDNVTAGIGANPKTGIVDGVNNSIITLTLDNTVPLDNDIDIGYNPSIDFVFNQNIVQGTGILSLKKSSDDSLVESISGTSLTVNPETPTKATWQTTVTLDSDTDYYVLASPGIVKSLFDGQLWIGIITKTEFNFTTAETTVPTITSFFPMNNATRVPLPITSTIGTRDLDVEYILTFNIDVVAGAGSIYIYDSTGIVDSATVGEMTISGNTVTWTNPENMNPDTNYYVLADTGFVVSVADGSDWSGISNVSEFTFRTYSSVPNVIQNTPKDPMWDIGMFSGTGGNGINPDNPNGHANWWNVNPNRIASDYDRVDGNTGLFLFAETTEDTVRNLQERIKYGYDQGARSFFLNRPMGSDGTSHVSAASWETIEINKRTLMASTLKTISEGRFGEKVSINIFIGSGMYAGDDLRGWSGPFIGGGGFLLGDNRTAERKATSDTILNGWIDEAGVSGIIIDHGSPEDEREHFAGLGIDLWQEKNVYLMIEALPNDTDPDGPYPQEADLDHLLRVGAIATTDYFNHNDFQTRPHFNIHFDLDLNRVFVWYQGLTGMTDEEKADTYNYYYARNRFAISGDPVIFALALEDFNNNFGENYSLVKTIKTGATSSNDPIDTTFFFNRTELQTNMKLQIDHQVDTYGDPTSIRIVDPDGETVYWSVKPQFSDRFTVVGTDPDVVNGKLRNSAILPPEKIGIYKIVMKGYSGTPFDIYSTDTIDEWGVFCPAGELNEEVFDLDTGYMFVPGEAPTFYYETTGSVSITESDATPIVLDTEIVDEVEVDIETNSPTFGTDDVWVVNVSGSWELFGYSTPFVLCNSIEAANSIQSGTVLTVGILGLDDQRFYSVGDQRLHARILDVIDTLEDTDPASVIKTFDSAVDLWPENPIKYYAVTQYPNYFRAIHTAITRQNLDGESYSAGHMNTKEFMDNPIDAGTKTWGLLDSAVGGTFNFLHAWNDAGNPYYNDAEMGKRAKIAMLGEFRRIQGFRVTRDHTNRSSRLGSVGLGSDNALDHALYFGNEMNNISDEDVDALMPSLLDQMDRILGDSYTSTRNQDCITLGILVMAGKMWERKYGNTKLKDLCLEEARNICTTNGGVPEVSLPEAIGHDGSYSGLQTFEISIGYICSNGDPEWEFLRDTIERNINYWSHFVTPSAGDTGAYGFDSDSRTNMGSIFEQFTGVQYTLPVSVPLASRWTRFSGKYESASNASSAILAYIENMNTEITNNTDTEIIFDLGGAGRFQTFALWTDEISGIADIPESSTLLPCEREISEVSVTQKNHLIEVETPWYYCSLATFTPNRFYYENAFEQYRTPRAFDSVGGDWWNNGYPMDTVSDKRGIDCEEIGGFGISMLYSKKSNRPIITGRCINPCTTHQIVGVTAGGEVRWGLPDWDSASVIGRSYEIEGNVLTITYDLYGDQRDGDGPNGDYEIVKKITFAARNISITNTITRTKIETDEIISFYEYIPLVTSERIIGASARASVISAIENPEETVTSLGDEINIQGNLESTPLVEFRSQNGKEVVSYARIPIAIPGLGQTTSISYNIELPFSEEESVEIRDGDYNDVPAIISPALPRNRNRAGAIRNSSLFFKVNNRTFPLKGAGSSNSRVNNSIPKFKNRAIVQLDYLFDTENSFSEIRYTVNGDIPTKKSTLYKSPIELNKAISNGEIVSLKARVFDKESIVAGKILEFQFKIV